jgi:hypothetical protein
VSNDVIITTSTSRSMALWPQWSAELAENGEQLT